MTNSASIYVMDACAMTAFVRRESGAAVVDGLIAASAATHLAHAVNLCEVYYDTLRDSNATTAEATLAQIQTAGIELRSDLNPAFWRLVGQLKVNPGKMSLADCFALALAITTGGTLVTSDHEFDPVVPLGLCPILFIR